MGGHSITIKKMLVPVAVRTGSLHCFYKRVETDPLDRCSQAFGEFTLLPVERDNLPCQRYCLIFGQIFGKHPANFRSASTLASSDCSKPGLGAKESDVFHPGVAAAVRASRNAHLELGWRRFAIELLVKGKS